MKKFAIVAMAMGVALTGAAQKNVVKEATTAAKGGADIEQVLAIITPAFTNPETANSAEPYFVAGKAGFDTYDNEFKKKAIGQAADKVKMAKNLLQGYNTIVKALPLDSLPDEKGKVKPKYSDKIGSIVGGHYGDFNDAAAYFWEAQDYQGAYDSWETMINMPSYPVFAKHIAMVYPDTILSGIVRNQGVAAYQLGNKDLACGKFLAAATMGNPNKEAFDFALSCASELGHNDTILAICEAAMPYFGKEDNTYILQIIQAHINRAEYDKALKRIDNAISEDPANGALYRVKGFIYEYQDNKDQAAEYYKKAMEVDPQFAEAEYDYARVLYNIAGAQEDSCTDNAAYQKLRRELDPQYRQMKKMLVDAKEKAIAADNDDLDYKIDQLLELVNYKLGEE